MKNIIVLFEVELKEGRKQEYLKNAALLKDLYMPNDFHHL